MLKNLKNSNLFFLLCLVANLATLPALTASVLNGEKLSYTLGDDETESVFAGHCLNGEPYRLFFYQMEVDGLTQSFYDYSADINDGSKFD